MLTGKLQVLRIAPPPTLRYKLVCSGGVDFAALRYDQQSFSRKNTAIGKACPEVRLASARHDAVCAFSSTR